MTTVTVEDFEFVSDLLRKRSAISIGPGKEYLVESRLARLAREIGMPDLSALMKELRRPVPDPALRDRVIDAMTTNETSFFRDSHPFEALRNDLVPEAMKRNAGTRRLSIWSAASSSGQELYSIAMLLDTHFPALAGWDVTLLGTDLCTSVLERAREGRFSSLEVNRGLPAPYVSRYFAREGADYVIDTGLRARCRFQRLNLMDPWPTLPMFDIVFCRNVLIYFEVAVRTSIIERMRRVLVPGGHLLLGASESVTGVAGYTPVRNGSVVTYRTEG